MKRRRHLRSNIEWTLTIITMIMFVFVVSINDYEISFLPYYILMWAIVFVNIYVLRKYGKGVCNEDESN